MAKLSGNLYLSLSSGDEPFQPLGSTDPSAEKTKNGEVVYHDDARLLTRAWNHRDCEPTKITDDTTKFVLFIEDTSGPEGSAEVVERAVQDLKELYEEVFGKKGEGKGAFLGHTAVWSFQEGKNVVENDW
jgi:DNA/RNA-binding domain of Phe-tRNA-synthetase-like protein